jgi:glutamate/tyrosine decarboxylase-like PLP-dependent enzyme
MTIALLERHGIGVDELLGGDFDAADAERLAAALERVTVPDLQVVLLDYGAAVRALGGALEVVGDPVAELARVIAGLVDWLRAAAAYGGFTAA